MGSGVMRRAAGRWRSSTPPMNPFCRSGLGGEGRRRAGDRRGRPGNSGVACFSVYDRAKILKKTAELMRERVDRIGRA